ncbi:nucleoside monophosphate kinase [Haliangium sp. UPWRP_2]|uniref:nucleoside monophosphate kinase n=1 Tax=Haliangium sp. UPWRP_2 TaxID=1931276 RepID=UPI001304AD9C|nr:nucleoside monophosphate kinase [Haliangium sp. UPWRP_2]
MLPIDGVPGAYLITGLLATAECELLIRAAEAVGLKPKVSKRRGPPIRNNSRALYVPGDALARELQGRLAPLLAQVDLSAIGGAWRLPADGQFLNLKWRINSYATGEAFLPHYDSGHDFGLGKRTLLSLIIYLNDDFTGGETTFFPGSTPRRPVSIRPRAGSALLFHHYGPLNPLHGTEPLTVTGRKKYIVRTDVIYEDGDYTLERLLFATPPALQRAVLLLGVPGAGKSTQLALLAKRHGFSALNFGECVRALRGGTSDLARALTAYREAAGASASPQPAASRWLPDDLSLRIFRANLPAVPSELLLLDGYPRMRAQSTQLETSRWLLLSAVYLKVPEQEQAARLAARDNRDRPPLDLAARMRDWERDTYPLIEHYRKRGVLDEVDATADPESTANSIEQVIEARIFDLIYSFVPAPERQRLAGYTPSKVNLSKKHRVYRFVQSGAADDRETTSQSAGAGTGDYADERYLKVVWEPKTQSSYLQEGALLAALKQERFPLDTPEVLSSFAMGPAVTGILCERVPGIPLKEVFVKQLAAVPLLVAQWARALARVHAFVPSRPEVFLTRSTSDLLAMAEQRLRAGAVAARSFSAKYGVAGALDRERELAELQVRLQALTFDQVRLNHGDPCAPNFIWSTRSRDITGCVDLSGVGFTDLHWDLSIACWSLHHNTSQSRQGDARERDRQDLGAEFVTEYVRCSRESYGREARVSGEKLDLMYRLARFLL